MSDEKIQPRKITTKEIRRFLKVAKNDEYIILKSMHAVNTYYKEMLLIGRKGRTEKLPQGNWVGWANPEWVDEHIYRQN